MLPPASRADSWGRRKPPAGTPVNPGHPLARGLVACWPYNDGLSRVRDLTLNGYDGTPSNLVTQAAGNFGGPALSFVSTGGTYVNCGAAINAAIASAPCSFVVWANPRSLGLNQDLFRNDNGGATVGFLLRVNTGNVLQFYSLPSVTLTQGSTALAAGVWYQFAATFDGGANKVLVYVNGVQDGSGSAGQASLGNSPFSFLHGAYFPDISVRESWGGLIDHGAVYNRVLSPADVAWLYREPFAFFQRPTAARLWSGGPPAAAAPTFNPGWAYGATRGVLGTGVG